MNIYTIQDKLTSDWQPEIRSVVEVWTHYIEDMEEFRKAIYVKSINHAKASQAKGWIFDDHEAPGNFSEEIQAFIGRNRFAALSWCGIKYFVRINPSVSEPTPFTPEQDAQGVTCMEIASVPDAIEWIKAQP